MKPVDNAMTDAAQDTDTDDADSNPMLARLIERCYSDLKKYARFKVGDAAMAEDLVQEACLRLAASRENIPINPRAYLYRILTNLVTDHRRRKARIGGYFVESDAINIADERPDSERELIARQRLELLLQAVSELPPRCGECFVLRRFEELSHAEIAKRMNITVSAVEKHLATATVHCVRRLKKYD